MNSSKLKAGGVTSRLSGHGVSAARSSRQAERTGNARLACLLGDADMLAALRLAGIKTVLMAEKASPLRRSRSVVGALPSPDAWAQPDRFVATLTRLGQRHGSRMVLFYQQDSELLAISRARAQLQDHFDFLMPPVEMVEDLVDKSRFFAIADDLGLPVPRTLVLGPGGRLPKRMPYPALVKPTVRDGRWESLHGRNKAAVAGSEKALIELWDFARQLGLGLVVQQLVEGPESAVLSYHAYVSRGQRTLGEFTGAKVRTRPATFGHTTALEVTHDRDVLEAGRRIRDQLQLVGVMKLDFKRAPDGRLYLLEVNPRFNLWHHPGAVAGVNLPAIAYADLTGTPLPMPALARAGVRWCRMADLDAAREAGMPLLAWLRWAARCEAKSGIAVRDPLPTIVLAARRAQEAAGRLPRR